MRALIGRRRLLGTIAIAPVAAFPVATASAGSRSGALRAAYEVARNTALNYHETVFEPEQERLVASIGKQPPLSFDRTARNGQTATFAVVPTARSPFNMPQYDMLHDEAAAAWNEWNARRSRFESDQRWRHVQARMTELFEAENDARRRFMTEPAANASALAFKLQLALGDFELAEGERVALLADAKRFEGPLAC